MNIRILVMSGMLAVSFAASWSASAAEDGKPSAQDNKWQTEEITDSKQYLAAVDRALHLAFRGEYGQLKRGADARLRAVRERIANLLEGYSSTNDLRPEDRVELINAEETLRAVIRNKDKNRMVCKLVAGTGSRIAKRECMTVAEREARAREARDNTAAAMRGLCVPGETSSCTK